MLEKYAICERNIFSSVTGDTMDASSGNYSWFVLIKGLSFLGNSRNHLWLQEGKRLSILPPDRFNTTKSNNKVVEMRFIVKLN